MHTTALFEQNSAPPAFRHAIQKSIPALYVEYTVEKRKGKW